MITKARGISSYVEGLLPESSAVVHSVYERTINIALSSGTMLAIQKETSPVSPLTLLAPDDSPLFLSSSGISPGMDVLITADAAAGGLKSIVMAAHSVIVPEDAVRFNTEVPSVTDVSGHLAFTPYIKNRDVSASADLIMQRAAAIKDEAALRFSESAFEESAVCLSGLIGLGGGLTPAGDDFITGLITGIHAVSNSAFESASGASAESSAAFSKALFDKVRADLEKTNDISSAFLAASLDAHTSIPLKRFLEDPSGSAVKEISEIGHSSGMDALEGLLYFFGLL